jgi:hypothetical protein
MKMFLGEKGSRHMCQRARTLSILWFYVVRYALANHGMHAGQEVSGRLRMTTAPASARVGPQTHAAAHLPRCSPTIKTH